MTDEKDVDLSASEDAKEQEAPSPEENAAGEESPPEESTPSAEDVAADLEVSEDHEVVSDLPGDEKELPAEEPDDKIVNESDADEADAEAAMMAMLDELPDEEPGATPDDIDFGTSQVSQAEFQQLSEPAGSAAPSNIDMLMDVDLPVAIELGRTKMSINDILALGPGAVVELNKLAGEPVDLLVNYKVVARGEVVVVDENFGLRITQLLTPEERLKSLAKD